VRVRDIGRAGIGHAIRFGILGRDHDDDLVQGIVLMRKGENPDAVIAGVRAKVHEVQKTLPAGVSMHPYYSRDRLVRTTVTTVMRNLLEGAGLVIVLLSLFLGNLRAALIVALTIPLAVIGSLVLTLTLLPVLTSFLFRHPPSERESPILRALRTPYLPALRFCLRRPAVPVGATAAMFALALVAFTLLGKEFLPELDEGDIWLRVKFPVGISLEDANPYVHDIRERLL